MVELHVYVDGGVTVGLRPHGVAVVAPTGAPSPVDVAPPPEAHGDDTSPPLVSASVRKAPATKALRLPVRGLEGPDTGGLAATVLAHEAHVTVDLDPRPEPFQRGTAQTGWRWLGPPDRPGGGTFEGIKGAAPSCMLGPPPAVADLRPGMTNAELTGSLAHCWWPRGWRFGEVKAG